MGETEESLGKESFPCIPPVLLGHFFPQTYLELAHRMSGPFFLSISILAPLSSVQGKHIQPVFKVVKLFLQGAIVDLKGKGLSDRPMARILAQFSLPDTHSPSGWGLLSSGIRGL